MCGIAGIYDAAGDVRHESVRAMADLMRHRGPDGYGEYKEGPIALAMRRLAIIDPFGGQQPLYNEQRDVVVIFNGEIYNHTELRTWLEGRGHTLSSGSDGAVLPHLYEELGETFASRINGIFGIALWDRSRQRLLLARDKFGVKPLYWARVRGKVVFASELRPLLMTDHVPRDLDYEAIDHFLTFRFIPSPRTPFASISKLPPASTLVAEEERLTVSRYWSGEMTANRRDRAELVDEYRDTFEQAVVRQMMSDRPIGVMLSGGVDSGAITGVMAQHSHEVKTFTIGFAEGGDSNEISLAKQTAELFGTSHESLLISSAEYLRDLPGAFSQVEEPVGTSSALAVRYVSDLMRSSVVVGLCGQGADEPWGGYWRHLGVKLASGIHRIPLPAATWSLLTELPISPRLERGLRTLAANSPGEMLMAAYRLFTERQKHTLYSDWFAERAKSSHPQEVVDSLRRPVASLAPLDQMLYVDTRLWLPDELLLIADKLSMAASLELRVPFLDENLVALVESMHTSQKVRGFSRKSLHKKAMLKWLPPEVVYRKERGWATPMAPWLRRELLPLLRETLLAEGGLARELFREAELVRMMEDHASGRRALGRQLFCLLSLGLWHRGVTASSYTTERTPAHVT